MKDSILGGGNETVPNVSYKNRVESMNYRSGELDSQHIWIAT